MLKVLFFLTFSSVNAWAMSQTDFITRTVEHRYRVKVGMHALFGLKHDRFLHVTPDLIEQYAELHDAPKITNNGITSVLARHFGVNRHQLFGAAKEEFEQTIDELNRIESAQKAAFFDTIDASAGAELSLLEKIADVVDTGIFRTKELGIAFIRRDAAMFLANEGAESAIVELAEILEDFIITAAPIFAAA